MKNKINRLDLLFESVIDSIEEKVYDTSDFDGSFNKEIEIIHNGEYIGDVVVDYYFDVKRGVKGDFYTPRDKDEAKVQYNSFDLKIYSNNGGLHFNIIREISNRLDKLTY